MTEAVRKRPRNRRALILRAAAALFAEHGYERVSMADVAELVEVRPSALYTHVRNKQDLLHAAIVDEFELAQALVAARSTGGLDSVLHELAGFALDHRHLGVLWQRESRHLSVNQLQSLLDDIRDAVGGLTVPLRAARPTLSVQQARFLVRCLFSVLLSPAQHDLTVPRPGYDVLMAELGERVMEADIGALFDLGQGATPGSLTPRSRRESLLNAATGLFAQHSFAGTSMDDIGHAVGISGPSVYNHFASKTELLVVAVSRAITGLRIELSRVLSSAADQHEAMHTLVGSYRAFAFAHSALIDVLVAESANLPGDERAKAREEIRDYIDEWVHLLQSLTATEPGVPARIRVIAALSMINDVARTPHLRAITGVDAAVTAVAVSVLLGAESSGRGRIRCGTEVLPEQLADGVTRQGGSD